MGGSPMLFGTLVFPHCEGCWCKGRRHLGSLGCSPGVVVPMRASGGSPLCPLGTKGSW